MEVAPPKEEEPKLTWKDNPNDCEPDRIRADNLECLPDEPKVVSSTTSSQPSAETISLSERENYIVSHYRSVGFTDVSIANLLGTIKQESGVSHNGPCGDGGRACGLFQWHPDRRHDMPSDFFLHKLGGL